MSASSFRPLLQKIGSGPHTSRDLTRSEAAAAAEMMLNGEATPAQIGAFLIAHRIKRPTAEELAGILDTYEQWCPPLPDLGLGRPVVVLGNPYDGRSRTAPLVILTALILSAAGVPVLLHGGDRLPTKYGLPLITIWQGLGLDFTTLDRSQVSTLLQTTNLTFFYTPRHFPALEPINAYRDQIGKRPPLATVELIWLPYAGPAHLVAGFVHPPTEQFIQGALALRGVKDYTLVKGLEGSCDLPRDRTAIISYSDAEQSEPQRLKLHSRDYDLGGKEVPLVTEADVVGGILATLKGEQGDYQQGAIWNGGFYLWRCGVCPSLTAGLATAQDLLTNGSAAAQLAQIRNAAVWP
ncbi:anthranilate phosphoribosyltransferase family protein [Spirulina sp. CCNP1310]|uniref:anthranilate phosphoribosyltransferase family protein n=1 Tax=Spirulina sp. CCNP1310 TaxID=3110249 RepID=UPI002B206B95|nr:anthranilate phosphoribosyltransferase family protein [Spirulina sp. CCNP1310]MEA5420766.1 anthranilate phosphoribosyltransferase family protein [Spirulina sp. CCNP1310]